MKKVVSLLLALCMALTLAACGSKTAAPAASAAASAPAASSAASGGENVELTVFAAASMTETLNQIIEMYKTVAPNVTIVPTYDSSGTLLKQIQAGAECDLFISAAQKQMNALDGSLADDAEKNPDKLDMELSKEEWQAQPDKNALNVTVAPQDLLLLRADRQEERVCSKPQF